MNIVGNGMFGHLNQFTPRNNSIHNFQKMVQKINANAEAKITNDNTQLVYNIKALMKEDKKIEAKKEEEVQQVANSVGDPSEEEIAEMANNVASGKRNLLMSLATSMHELSEHIKYVEEEVADLERLAAGDFTEEELERFPREVDQKIQKKFANQRLEIMQETLDDLYSNVPILVERQMKFDLSGMNMYIKLYGEDVKEAIEDRLGDVLDGINSESLGLKDLGTDMKKVTEALDAAAEAVRKRVGKLEENYKQCNGTEMEAYGGTVRSDEELREQYENTTYFGKIKGIKIEEDSFLQLDSEALRILQEAINNGWIKEAGNFVDAKA